MLSSRTLIATAGLLLPLSTLAPAPERWTAETQEHSDEHEEDVLHESMEVLNGSLRELRGLLRSGGAVADMLPVVDRIELAIVQGKGATPESVSAVPEEQREAFVLDFRREQLLLLTRFTRLEEMLLDGDTEGASKFLNDEIMSMKKPSHERFKREGGWTPR